MPATVKDMMAAAQAVVSRITPQEAQALIAQGSALVVDLRDGTEIAASGRVKGALHISRGLLEFKADPQSPAYEPALRSDRTILLYCGSGGRAALAGKLLKDMGYADVRNLGGFADWVKAGGAVEK